MIAYNLGTAEIERTGHRWLEGETIGIRTAPRTLVGYFALRGYVGMAGTDGGTAAGLSISSDDLAALEAYRDSAEVVSLVDHWDNSLDVEVRHVVLLSSLDIYLLVLLAVTDDGSPATFLTTPEGDFLTTPAGAYLVT
jgi:hypothetical protein